MIRNDDETQQMYITDSLEILSAIEENVAELVTALTQLGLKKSQAASPTPVNRDSEAGQAHVTAQVPPSTTDEMEAVGSVEPFWACSDAAPPSQTSIRVDVTLLNTLMTLAGELVLSRDQLVQGMSAGNRRAQENASQRIDMITSELQEAIMQTRMQPIGGGFSKYNRVVRDLAWILNKSVHLTMEGNEVKLDKTILETVAPPLSHLIRNAVEHGIEPPEVRKMAGKHPEGLIRLRAFHEADQVNIEISDDGQGIDWDSLVHAAVSKGLLTTQQTDALSEKEKRDVIFLPGVTTSNRVTDLSLRGVGMDMAKTTLDKLGGTIEIESERGRGTVIRIRVP